MTNLLALLHTERNHSSLIQESPEWHERNACRKDIVQYLQEVHNSQDIDQILNTERMILEYERTHYSNSKAMQSSLSNALVEIDQTFRMLARVRDPERYQETDQVHGSKKKRDQRNALPMDDARNSFNAHSARFTNLNKSRLDGTEKTIIDMRQKNIRFAKDLYIALQRQALGIAPIEKAKSSGLEM